MTKLTITVGDPDSLTERTRDRLHAIEEGADPEALDEIQPELRFGSYAELFDLLSEKRLELLRAIATNEPDSIAGAADLVDRDYKAVHRHLSELAELGVIQWGDSKPGTQKKPILRYDELEIDLDLAEGERGEPATA